MESSLTEVFTHHLLEPLLPGVLTLWSLHSQSPYLLESSLSRVLSLESLLVGAFTLWRFEVFSLESSSSGVPISGVPTSGVPTSGVPTSGVCTRESAPGSPHSGVPTPRSSLSGVLTLWGLPLGFPALEFSLWSPHSLEFPL